MADKEELQRQLQELEDKSKRTDEEVDRIVKRSDRAIERLEEVRISKR